MIKNLGRVVGNSAYEDAIETGYFVGTIEEWFESLRGPKGDTGTDGDGKSGTTFIPNITQNTEDTATITWTNTQDVPNPDPVTINLPEGPQGPEGEQGLIGPVGTIFTPVVTTPFVDTLRLEWTNDSGLENPEGMSITAPQGIQGEKGDKGDTGAQGIQGEKGDIGNQGVQGISAYEVAVEEGYIGTEAEWLLTLVGPEGPKGNQGDLGNSGSSFTDAVISDNGELVLIKEIADSAGQDVGLATNFEWGEGVLTTKAPTVKQVTDSLNAINTGNSGSGAELATDVEYTEGIIITKAPTVKQVKSDIINLNARLLHIETVAAYDRNVLLKKEGQSDLNLALQVENDNIIIPSFKCITSLGITKEVTEVTSIPIPTNNTGYLYYDWADNLVKTVPNVLTNYTNIYPIIGTVKNVTSLSSYPDRPLQSLFNKDVNASESRWVANTPTVGQWIQFNVPEIEKINNSQLFDSFNIQQAGWQAAWMNASTLVRNRVDVIYQDDTIQEIGTIDITLANKGKLETIDFNGIDTRFLKAVKITCISATSGSYVTFDEFMGWDFKNPFLNIVDTEQNYYLEYYTTTTQTPTSSEISLLGKYSKLDDVLTLQGYRLF